MNRIKEVSVEFKDSAKKLKKKYKSFVDDMKAFEQELLENPYLGVSL